MKPLSEPTGHLAGAASGVGAGDLIDASVWQRLQALDPTGQHGLLQRLVQAFATSLERNAADMALALAHQNLDGLRVAAHTLKSSAASLGALSLSALCAQMEQDCRSGQATGLAERVPQLLAQGQAVKLALSALVAPLADAP